MLSRTDRLLTVPEVARRLRLSEETVYRRVRTGELPVVKVGLGPKAPLRIPAIALERWILERSFPSEREFA